jgi:hypothetical protein
MATYDITFKQKGVSGPKKIYLGGNNEGARQRLENLETKVEEQSNKLDKITSMLNAISEKTPTS